MAISKKALALCIIAFVVCSFAVDNVAVEARMIDYGALRRDTVPCKKPPCIPPPSNSYNRGCEKIKDCRGAPGRRA
ncbi:hypothetical protein BT93_H0596 [Corymbia citriodora subsp. variegata]|nr:hypothetical protein BT93_H0596 [Corymbia citriodora subsp. variegata]